MPILRDLTNQRFGRLIALYPTEKRIGSHVVWLCRCDCGNLKEIVNISLLSGDTKSCGCINKEVTAKRSFKHGDAGKPTRLYVGWVNMKPRCLNPDNPHYKYYGGKDISICDEWLNDYPAFKEWALANGYADNLVIDRIDNDGDYAPNNCRWITNSENVIKSWKEKRERQ